MDKEKDISPILCAGGRGGVQACSNCMYNTGVCENDKSEYFKLSKPFTPDHPFDCKSWRWG